MQDGKIDFAAMDSEAAKQLNDLLHDPDVQAQFSIGPLRDRFDPAHCKRLYEAIGLFIAGSARLAFKWPEAATEKLKYTEEEKEELAQPTASVLDETAPKWLREHQALVALVLVFGAITQNKLREAQAIALEHAKAKRGMVTPVASGSAPIPTPATQEALREELHTDMRKAGIKTTVVSASVPNPTPPDQVTLGPSGGPSVEPKK